MECILSLLFRLIELKAKSFSIGKSITRESCKDVGQKLELNPKLTQQQLDIWAQEKILFTLP